MFYTRRKVSFHRLRLLGDLLTSAAALQKTKRQKTELLLLLLVKNPGYGALAVTSVREALASEPKLDPLGRGTRGVPDRGSTVPPGQAGWPCEAQC